MVTRVQQNSIASESWPLTLLTKQVSKYLHYVQKYLQYEQNVY